MPRLFATSDLHVTHRGNGPLVDEVVPETDGDWLLVAGDVAEKAEVVAQTLATLRDRFAKVVWVPGNHELWTTPRDEIQLRGESRYHYLVERCRDLGVLTPEDEYPVWEHGERPLTIVPMFLLYDYSWRTREAEDASLDDALAQAREAGVVCTDEFYLHPDPYPTRQDWCAQRLKVTEQRLAAIPDDHGTVLMSHWPLHRHPTAPLHWPEFAMWCGTEATTDWHVRYRAEVAVFGHLHIPRTTHADGVRFEEVSLGYPREWQKRARGPIPLRAIL